MKNIINFLIEVNKLKKMKRTGLVWLEVKNPETIAQHCFRVAIMNWIFAKKILPPLNLEKIIKISLAHDLCEVSIKTKRAKEKFKKEEAALNKLIRFLPSKVKKGIKECWLEYERLGSREGRFAKQGDKVETLLQAFEYWGSNLDSVVPGWRQEVEDLVNNPILLDFLEKIEERFYKKNKKNNEELEFLLKIGKLKQMVRSGWILREVKNGSTVAEDAFLLAIAIWLLNERKKLNLEKMLKMSLVYEICEVYAEEIGRAHV